MKVEPEIDHSGMEFGIYTLADLRSDPYTGIRISARQRLNEIIQAAKMADEAGLDVFGVGEHHRLDYAVSSPQMVLSSISQVTKRIKLTSAATIFNTVDPVRLFEDFATLDLLSNGRAEIMAGRGAYIESFPLFGYNLDNCDDLFEENIHLFRELSAHERVTWTGRFRSEFLDAEISPRPLQKNIPLWIGVQESLESAARAGRFGTGLALVVFDGDPIRFKPLVDRYRQSAYEAGHAPADLKVGVTGHVYIAETTQKAREEFYPYHISYWENDISRADFERLSGEETALFVGSSQQIIEKILRQYELFGHQRFMAQMDMGGMPFKKVAENIERLATEIAPAVRKAIQK
ncbi:LLM class flavin-dependent oxidoreductase [Paenibacillus alba]|uniref:LLM class flavin-dependent oxidoreductase n=1 Tax=Paenibacillus alba TaxID=1197127 RepID=A0ABU6FX32_9BACL|nr:LLM class flavin-dependent oxidoreductase [Paenibacillus alba]MEC0226432.1 LLM class flavin-dependent oxidoreductase [Paenibacillus alba]NQX66395.1 LLM class flavin-dependent oxidoreductase [Paenibacillus alba]